MLTVRQRTSPDESTTSHRSTKNYLLWTLTNPTNSGSAGAGSRTLQVRAGGTESAKRRDSKNARDLSLRSLLPSSLISYTPERLRQRGSSRRREHTLFTERVREEKSHPHSNPLPSLPFARPAEGPSLDQRRTPYTIVQSCQFRSFLNSLRSSCYDSEIRES